MSFSHGILSFLNKYFSVAFYLWLHFISFYSFVVYWKGREREVFIHWFTYPHPCNSHSWSRPELAIESGFEPGTLIHMFGCEHSKQYLNCCSKCLLTMFLLEFKSWDWKNTCINLLIASVAVRWNYMEWFVILNRITWSSAFLFLFSLGTDMYC